MKKSLIIGTCLVAGALLAVGVNCKASSNQASRDRASLSAQRGNRGGGPGGPGGHGGPMSDMADQLGLTAQQKTDLEKIQSEMRAKMEEQNKGGGLPDRSKMDALMQEERTKMEALLTAEQKTKMQQLLKDRQPPSGGGPGGGPPRGAPKGGAK